MVCMIKCTWLAGRGKTATRGGPRCGPCCGKEAKNDRKWKRNNREEAIHGYSKRDQEIQARHI